MNYKSGVCTFCGTGCGNFLNIRDGRVQGVFPSKNHPVSKGRLCVRGWHLHELLMTDQRLTKPMVRSEGSLKEVSYEEAVGFMMDRMSPYREKAGENIGFIASPRSSNEENYLLMKLARGVFGTNNISLESESGHRSSLDVLARGTGMAGMTGSFEEIEKTDFILIVGSDITKMNPIVGSEIHKARMNGARVVTICSRITQAAKLSSTHLQIKPGSKKIILSAIAKAILAEGLEDSEFISSHTEGFEDFAAGVSDLDFDRACSLTGIDYESIAGVARELGKAKSAMAFWSSGISGLDESTVSFVYNLFLLAGKVGREACGVNPVAGICNLQGAVDMGAATDLLTGFQSITDGAALQKFEDAWSVKLNPEPGKNVYELLGSSSSGLKALVVAEHDEGEIRYEKEIADLDFVVYIGSYDNPFTQYADVVFPVAGAVEKDGTYTNAERRVQLSGKRVEPLENVLNAWQLFSMIAARDGKNWNYNSGEEVFREIASLTPAYSGMDYGKLENSFGIQWPCNEDYPEGCRRLDLSMVKGNMKFVPVVQDTAVPESSSDYPFLMITGQGQHFWHQNVIMKKTYIPKREYNATLLLYPRGYVEICSEDAEKLKVRNKWPVRVTSAHGSMEVDVHITSDIKPGTAYIPYFIRAMISEFLLEHMKDLNKGEDAIIPVRIERV